MSPTPNPPAFTEAVLDYLSDARDQFNYDQLLETFLSVERFERWARVVGRHRDLAGARFLSSGCGFAGSLVAYRDAGASVCAGVEVDDDYAHFGALRTDGLAGAGVVRYDGQRLPFGDGAFDVVESMDVVEHTSDPRRYLGELVRVLAPAGVILLVTPNRLWPVEQHLGVAGPPWLPVRVADALFGALARAPGLGDDRRFRYRALRGMRTQNVSLRRLTALAKDLGLFLELLRPGDYGADWPLPAPPTWADRLAGHRVGKLVAPVPTLVVLLHRGGPVRPVRRIRGRSRARSRR